METNYNESHYTINVYWNSTKFTSYKHLRYGQYSYRDGFLSINYAPGRTINIPYNTINRFEVVDEGS